MAMAAATTVTWAVATMRAAHQLQLLHQLAEEDIFLPPTTATTTTTKPALHPLQPLQVGGTLLLPPQLLPQVSGLHLVMQCEMRVSVRVTIALVVARHSTLV